MSLRDSIVLFDSFGFGCLESVYRRVLAVELRHAGLAIEAEVPFELIHLGESASGGIARI